jgi:uncharacterized membrane protein YeaQ/YmgE (transglycosylase-associated protein family)
MRINPCRSNSGSLAMFAAMRRASSLLSSLATDLADATVGKRLHMVPDTVTLIIWLLAGVSGGFAVGDVLKGNFDMGPARNAVAGAVGGVVGAKILQLLIPALNGFDVIPIVGQVIGAAASGVALTVLAGAVGPWRRR